MNASAEIPKNESNSSHDSMNSQPNFTEVSIKSRLEGPTRDSENRCATSLGQNGAQVLLIVEAVSMPVDEEEDTNRLIDHFPVLQKTPDDLTMRTDDSWKFPLSGFIRNTLLNFF